MRNLSKALVAAGIISAAVAAPAASAAEAMPSVKLSVYSEYEYRGISQTRLKPAVQFGVELGLVDAQQRQPHRIARLQALQFLEQRMAIS